jgi:DNA-binding transcriptional MocR family regulator
MQRQLVIQAPKAGQYLGLRLLRTLASWPGLRKAVVTQYQDCWETARHAFDEIGAAGVRLAGWEGGLFLWLEWYGPPSDLDVMDAMCREGIGVMPGSALFVPGRERRSDPRRQRRPVRANPPRGRAPGAGGRTVAVRAVRR